MNMQITIVFKKLKILVQLSVCLKCICRQFIIISDFAKTFEKRSGFIVFFFHLADTPSDITTRPGLFLTFPLQVEHKFYGRKQDIFFFAHMNHEILYHGTYLISHLLQIRMFFAMGFTYFLSNRGNAFRIVFDILVMGLQNIIGQKSRLP